MTDGPLFGGAVPTNDDLFSLVNWFGTLVRYAQGRPLLCVCWSLRSLLAQCLPWLREYFRKRDRALFLLQGIAPNCVSERRID